MNQPTNEPMNSPISRDTKRLEQCRKNFLTKLALKVIKLGNPISTDCCRSIFQNRQSFYKSAYTCGTLSERRHIIPH